MPVQGATGPLIGLILALFGYLGPVEIRTADAPVVATEANGVQHLTAARATACVDGHAHIEAVAGALLDPVNLAHELLHLADCRDDGVYNGSLDPTYGSEVTGDRLHSWVYWSLRNPDAAQRLIEGLPR